MQLTFGARQPYLVFRDQSHFYNALGFLVRSSETGVCRFVLENNQNQGAWGHECRIQIFGRLNDFQNLFIGRVSAGIGNCLGRINCNQYLEYLENRHNFEFQGNITFQSVSATVPAAYTTDFQAGYNM